MSSTVAVQCFSRNLLYLHRARGAYAGHPAGRNDPHVLLRAAQDVKSGCADRRGSRVCTTPRSQECRCFLRCVLRPISWMGPLHAVSFISTSPRYFKAQRKNTHRRLDDHQAAPINTSYIPHAYVTRPAGSSRLARIPLCWILLYTGSSYQRGTSVAFSLPTSTTIVVKRDPPYRRRSAAARCTRNTVSARYSPSDSYTIWPPRYPARLHPRGPPSPASTPSGLSVQRARRPAATTGLERPPWLAIIMPPSSCRIIIALRRCHCHSACHGLKIGEVSKAHAGRHINAAVAPPIAVRQMRLITQRPPQSAIFSCLPDGAGCRRRETSTSASETSIQRLRCRASD